jgi:hypothetical protein
MMINCMGRLWVSASYLDDVIVKLSHCSIYGTLTLDYGASVMHIK